MGAIEEIRQVMQDFLAPELREIRARLDSIDKRLDLVDTRFDLVDKRFDMAESGYDSRYQALVQRLDAVENANGVRDRAVIQRLDQIQQSFAFDRRISSLDADKTGSASSSPQNGSIPQRFPSILSNIFHKIAPSISSTSTPYTWRIFA